MSRYALAFGQAFGQGMGQGQQSAAQRIAFMLREAEMRRREQEFGQEMDYRQSAAGEQARQFDARQLLDEQQFGLQRDRQAFDVRKYEADTAADERTTMADASFFDAVGRGEDMSTLLQSGAFDPAALSPGVRTQVFRQLASRQELEAKRPRLQAKLEMIDRAGMVEPGSGLKPAPDWLIKTVEEADEAGAAIPEKVRRAYFEALNEKGLDPAARRFDDFTASGDFEQAVNDVMMLNPSLANNRPRAEAFVRSRKMGLVNQEDANISGRASGGEDLRILEKTANLLRDRLGTLLEQRSKGFGAFPMPDETAAIDAEIVAMRGRLDEVQNALEQAYRGTAPPPSPGSTSPPPAAGAAPGTAPRGLVVNGQPVTVDQVGGMQGAQELWRQAVQAWQMQNGGRAPQPQDRPAIKQIQDQLIMQRQRGAAD